MCSFHPLLSPISNWNFFLSLTLWTLVSLGKAHIAFCLPFIFYFRTPSHNGIANWCTLQWRSLWALFLNYESCCFNSSAHKSFHCILMFLFIKWIQTKKSLMGFSLALCLWEWCQEHWPQHMTPLLPFCTGGRHPGWAGGAVQLSPVSVRGSLPVCFQHVCTAKAEIWHSVVVFVEISLFLQSWRTVFSLGQNCDLQKWVWRGGILHPWAAGCRCALGNSTSEDSFLSNLALPRYVKWWSTDIILPPSTVFPCYHFLSRMPGRGRVFLAHFSCSFPLPHCLSMDWCGRTKLSQHKIMWMTLLLWNKASFSLVSCL